MQVRLHDCEKMNVYLLSSNGFKFFIDICNNAIKNIQEDVEESISGAQLSRINQLIALREAVNDASKTIRWVFFFSLVVTRYLRFLRPDFECINSVNDGLEQAFLPFFLSEHQSR